MKSHFFAVSRGANNATGNCEKGEKSKKKKKKKRIYICTGGIPPCALFAASLIRRDGQFQREASGYVLIRKRAILKGNRRKNNR